jgi:hypothetical protein
MGCQCGLRSRLSEAIVRSYPGDLLAQGRIVRI